MLPKVRDAATDQERATMYLAANVKRFALDMMAMSKTAENI